MLRNAPDSLEGKNQADCDCERDMACLFNDVVSVNAYYHEKNGALS